jgi:hypothetical protein
MNDMNLSPTLFWDSNKQKIDFQLHARQIIQRVLTRGSLSDWYELLAYYGKEKICAEIVEIRSLDALTLNFCSRLFHIPKSQFRCYNTQQSIQELWNY